MEVPHTSDVIERVEFKALFFSKSGMVHFVLEGVLAILARDAKHLNNYT